MEAFPHYAKRQGNPCIIGPHLNTCHRATRMKPCLSEGAWPTLGSIPSSDVHTSISEFATAHRKHQLPSSTSKQSTHYYTQSNTTADRRSIQKPAHTPEPNPRLKTLTCVVIIRFRGWYITTLALGMSRDVQDEVTAPRHRCFRPITSAHVRFN